MATPLLGLALPTTGSLTGAWGDTVNNSITSLLDSAVAGTTTLSSDVDVTLTTTQEAANQAREAILLWTASGSTTRNITAPAQSKSYIVINASGTQSIVLRGAGPTTGVTVAAGEKALCAWNGSDFVKVSSTAASGVTSVTATAPVSSTGGTTPVISMAAATTSANGYLTSTDWNTFNGKQSTITLTTTGTGGAATLVGTTLNIPNYSAGSSGVSTISIASSNGFSGTSSGGSTPALTLQTTVTGLVKGSGGSLISATSGTDYAPATSGSSILYGNSSGGFSNVVVGSGLNFSSGTLTATGGGSGTVTSVGGTGTVNGITLSGTVTTSGSLTLGGSLSGVSLTSQVSGTLPVANGGTGVTTSTGSGNVVLSTSPTLVTPILGTPTSGTLTNCTSIPVNQATGTLAVTNGGTGGSTSTGSGAVVLATSPTITTPVISGNTTVNNINLGTGSNAGLYTTVFGVASGSALTSSSYGTTALGYNALTASTDGVQNTAVGYVALKANTTGDSNTALGAAALFTNITGFQNTAVGVGALNKSTSSNNTSVGHQAGLNVTTGAQNTLIGKSAGSPINTSSNNTALGWYAAGGTTIGATNTALGAIALSGTTSTSAVDNTAVGYAALSTLTSFNNCSALGANTDVTGNNQVQLGNSSTTTYVYGTVQNRSDIRDKADVRDTQLGLNFVNALRPVDFKWDARDDYKPPMPEDLTDKEAMAAWAEACNLSNITHDGSKKRSRYHHGLIAQEVKAVLDAQGIDFGGYQDHKVKDGQDVLTIGYDELIAPLIKAIQELTARVQDLEAKA